MHTSLGEINLITRQYAIRLLIKNQLRPPQQIAALQATIISPAQPSPQSAEGRGGEGRIRGRDRKGTHFKEQKSFTTHA